MTARVKLNTTRSLDVIAALIHKVERASIFDKGDLLLEAREQLSEDEGWLAWLGREFNEFSDDSARRYMNAARMAARFRTVRNLKVPARVIYDLAIDIDDEALPKIIKALEKASQHRRLKLKEAEDVIRLSDPGADYGPPRRIPHLSHHGRVNRKCQECGGTGVKYKKCQGCGGDIPRWRSKADVYCSVECGASGRARASTFELVDALNVILRFERAPVPKGLGGISAEELDRIEHFIGALRDALDDDGDADRDEVPPSRPPRAGGLTNGNISVVRGISSSVMRHRPGPCGTSLGTVTFEDEEQEETGAADVRPQRNPTGFQNDG